MQVTYPRACVRGRGSVTPRQVGSLKEWYSLWKDEFSEEKEVNLSKLEIRHFSSPRENNKRVFSETPFPYLRQVGHAPEFLERQTSPPWRAMIKADHGGFL